MIAPSVSVVIVSHGRPDALLVALTGTAQLDYPTFEIVVVADVKGAAAVRAHALAERVKIVAYDTPNISAARNVGIAASAGEIIAFIDDDAVPEPTWLTHLTGPFSDLDVAATGGYVIGRNGISFQWKARTIGPDAQATELPISDTKPHVFDTTAARVIKTEGTNMAVRRDVLDALGGFDEAFQFYLDETDLNMRLAGRKIAIVPLAQVHHGFAASGRRRADRVPTDLTQIGASLAVYFRKHGMDLSGFDLHRAEQRLRLLRHMVSGALLPEHVGRILASFDAGWAQGLQRDYGARQVFAKPPAFLPMTPTVTGKTVTLAGRFWQRAARQQQARDAVVRGQRMSVIILSPTALFHRVAFTADGYWLQTGGQFGKSDRAGRFWQAWRGAARIAAEKARVAQVRQID